jgi:hypothetical protein
MFFINFLWPSSLYNLQKNYLFDPAYKQPVLSIQVAGLRSREGLGAKNEGRLIL